MFIELTDLQPFAPDLDAARGNAMIADAEAMAIMAAPCLEMASLTVRQAQAVKAVLRAAVLRWHERGTGAKTTVQQTAGPFSQTEGFDTRTLERQSGLFWPDEIASLQRVCEAVDSDSRVTEAFTITPAYDGG